MGIQGQKKCYLFNNSDGLYNLAGRNNNNNVSSNLSTLGSLDSLGNPKNVDSRFLSNLVSLTTYQNNYTKIF